VNVFSFFLTFIPPYLPSEPSEVSEAGSAESDFGLLANYQFGEIEIRGSASNPFHSFSVERN
jgi:hypothetical protein